MWYKISIVSSQTKYEGTIYENLRGEHPIIESLNQADFENTLTNVIEMFQNYKNSKTLERNKTDSSYKTSVGTTRKSINYQYHLRNNLQTDQLLPGLPNIGNSCYINSVLQSLRLVFNNCNITLKPQLKYSSSLSRIFDTLNTSKGVNVSEFNELINKLRSDNWANGEVRDAKEFFTFIVNKLKTEENTEIENLFTSKIQKQYKSTKCNHLTNYFDSVMIINFIGSVDESIRKRTSNISMLNDFECSKCYRNSTCQEKISCIEDSKVKVIYFDPSKKQEFWQLYSHNTICTIVFVREEVCHFKVIAQEMVYDDSFEYSAVQRQFSKAYDIYSCNLPYLAFIKPISNS